MEEAGAYITLTIDLEEPIELSDFADLFASLSAQFDDFLRETRPDLQGDARIFIKEVREGSIVADMIPMMVTLVEFMDRFLIVRQFSEWVKIRVRTYADGKRLPAAKKSDLSEIAGMVKAVARNTGGTAKIESVHFRDGKRDVELAMTFNTQEAQKALETIEAHKIDLDKSEYADHTNVLMVFFQANLKSAALDKKHGEQVIIEAIDPRPKPLIYGADLAKERIKSEFGDAIFKKGFFVDVNVETFKGRIVAYRVNNVRDVINLPDD